MSNYNAVRKVIAATALASAIGLTSLAGGSASADGPKRPTETVYFTIMLTNGHATATNAGVPLIYQPIARNDAMPAPGEVPQDHILFSYGK